MKIEKLKNDIKSVAQTCVILLTVYGCFRLLAWLVNLLIN